MLRFVSATVCVLVPVELTAQNLSVADIAAMVDEAQAGNDDYRTLLNDPDPERARLAMKIMLEQGDAELQRIALDHGLFSNDPGVRRVALESFLRSGSFLAIRADGSNYIGNTLSSYVQRAGGTVDDGGIVHLNHQLGAFDEKQNCILWAGTESCAIRISDAAISLRHNGKWTDFTLGEDAVLRGGIYINQIGVLSSEIPVSP